MPNSPYIAVDLEWRQDVTKKLDMICATLPAIAKEQEIRGKLQDKQETRLSRLEKLSYGFAALVLSGGTVAGGLGGFKALAATFLQ